jgi:cytochrome c nitrite reductase small subunit
MKASVIKGIAVGSVLGLAIGIGGYTFIYAKGASYLTNNAAACANCHIMQEHYDGWLKSSHRSVATCNDCHTPSGTIPKYLTKADNGFWHSLAFTTGDFPEPLRAKPRNKKIAENSCFKCHQDIVHSILAVDEDGQMMSCVRCHREVGHPK